MKCAFAEDFCFLKNELQKVKAKIANHVAVVCSEVDDIKTTVKDLESGLSTWSYEVSNLQETVCQG